jgi:hypothetical protein
VNIELRSKLHYCEALCRVVRVPQTPKAESTAAFPNHHWMNSNSNGKAAGAVRGNLIPPDGDARAPANSPLLPGLRQPRQCSLGEFTG